MHDIRVSFPDWMMQQIVDKAKERDVTVSEHIRRCVILSDKIFDEHDNVAHVTNERTGTEFRVTLDDG